VTLAQDILSRTMSLIPVVLSLSVHEWAHAWAAAQLGDTTARDQGRMTLNPLAHVDLVGTLALPLLGVPFGWARPVPVDPTRFRQDVSMTKGTLLTAVAGPLANLVLALCCATTLLAGHRLHLLEGQESVADVLLTRALLVNAVLCAFNLLPVPPLDGSRIVDGLIPFEHRAAWRKAGPVALVVVVLLLVAIGSGWVSSLTRDLGAALAR
jgi:Zn-dependent protease